MALTHASLRDQLANGDVTRTATATFTIADTLQKHQNLKPGEAVGAMAAVFILTMESTGLSTSDILGLTKNLMADAHGRRPEFLAITDYLKKEILK